MHRQGCSHQHEEDLRMSGSSHKRDLRAELAADSGTHATTWNPVPGGILVGTFIGYERGQTADGESDIAVIEDEQTGGYVLVWLSSVLSNEFNKLHPMRGGRLAIKYIEIPGAWHIAYRLMVDEPLPSIS